MNRIFSALIWLNACSLVSSQSAHEAKGLIDCMTIQNANERINCLYSAEAFSDERYLRSRNLAAEVIFDADIAVAAPIPNDGSNLYDGTLNNCASVSIDIPYYFRYSNVKARVKVVHGAVGELVMFLLPANPPASPFQRVELMHRPGLVGTDVDSSNGGIRNPIANRITFDDSATTSSEDIGSLVTNPSPGESEKDTIPEATVTSTNQHYSKLETIFGLQAHGTWKLYVCDAKPGGNSGTIDEFRLIFTKLTEAPSASPSSLPSALPSAIPSALPSATPSATPSSTPSALPSATPSSTPSALPSATPSSTPSAIPSASPSALPSSIPSTDPTSVGFSYKEDFEGPKGVGSHGFWRDSLWVDGKNNAQLHRGFADSGNWCMRLRKDTGADSAIYLNMSEANYDLLNVKFSYITDRLVLGTSFVLEGTANVSDLTGPWVKFEDWVYDVDFQNNVRYSASKNGIIISSYSPNLMIRIRAITSATVQAVYVDDIEVVAITF